MVIRIVLLAGAFSVPMLCSAEGQTGPSGAPALVEGAGLTEVQQKLDSYFKTQAPESLPPIYKKCSAYGKDQGACLEHVFALRVQSMGKNGLVPGFEEFYQPNPEAPMFFSLTDKGKKYALDVLGPKPQRSVQANPGDASIERCAKAFSEKAEGNKNQARIKVRRTLEVFFNECRKAEKEDECRAKSLKSWMEKTCPDLQP